MYWFKGLLASTNTKAKKVTISPENYYSLEFHIFDVQTNVLRQHLDL